MSTIEIKGQGESEELIEHIVPVSEVKDPEIQLFLKLLNTQPEEDSVSVTKRLNSQGLIKRLIDNLPSFSSNKNSPDTQENNIFAPTAALKLFQKVKQIAPNHSLILADFDSFMMPRGSI